MLRLVVLHRVEYALDVLGRNIFVEEIAHQKL